jgi:UDP-N-acetylmuramyl pentapeptide phosphotransferase/UDP-N-acetylglucosamine-1-phosphate transferase
MPASVIIPAYRAAATIAQTLRAAHQIPGVSQVIVVDDGSDDGTGEAARSAGADTVIALPRNLGKGAALSAGVAAATAEQLLFLDADLGESAAKAGPLLDALNEMPTPAMVVAVLPSRPGAGGFGLAVGLARVAIRLLSGLRPKAPMSGQRAIAAALVRRIGLASRFAVEVGLTVEAAHVGAPMREVPLALDHAHTGRTLPGFFHRARQFRDILWLLLDMGYGLSWPALSSDMAVLRAVLYAVLLAGVIALGALATPSASGHIALACAGALLLWLPVLWLAAETLGLRKPNYLGRRLPSGAGLLFPVVALPALMLSGLGPTAKWAGIVTIGAFAGLGLADDLFAAGHQARGLRGHLTALLHGHVTTGAVKALGGLAAGVAAGVLLDPGQPLLIALDALLIALSANSINLLDLRPGRALKGFLMLFAIAVAVRPESLRLLAPMLAAAAVSAPSDLAGRAMIGDVGSNTLGAAAGLGLAMVIPPQARLAAVLVLGAFHLLCERRSLTGIIAKSPILRFLDRLGAAHLEPLPVETGEGIGR